MTPQPPPGEPGSPRRKFIWWIIGAIALLVLIVIGARYRAATPALTGRAGLNGPLTVGVASVTKGEVPITINALGTVTPLATVTVHPQINGPLVKIAFTEGQMVKRGDLLVQIDPRPTRRPSIRPPDSSSATRPRSPTPRSTRSATRPCWRRTRFPIRPTPRRWPRSRRMKPRWRPTGNARSRAAQPRLLPHHLTGGRPGGTAAGRHRQPDAGEQHPRSSWSRRCSRCRCCSRCPRTA
jgi:hypothetical protein